MVNSLKLRTRSELKVLELKVLRRLRPSAWSPRAGLTTG